jgi:hypothetical protein
LSFSDGCCLKEVNLSALLTSATKLVEVGLTCRVEEAVPVVLTFSIPLLFALAAEHQCGGQWFIAAVLAAVDVVGAVGNHGAAVWGRGDLVV